MKLLTAFTTLFLSFSFFSYSQLTEASAEVSVESAVLNEEDGTLMTYFNIVNNVTINDADFFGAVVITVYDSENGYPLAKIKKQKSDLDIQNNQFVVKIVGMENQSGYDVEIDVRDYQSNTLPLILKSL